MFVEIKNISVYYHKSLAIKDVTVNVPEAGVVSIIGANGAGKSTILKALVGLVPIQGGDIVFEGESLAGLETADRVKKGIVLVPEGRQLFPYLSVMTNLKLGATLRRDRAGIAESLEYVFELFPRLKERLKQNAGTLSGGEQQMLAIGRGLMAEPPTAVPGRAVGRSRSHRGGAGGRRDQGDQQARASASFSWSRTPTSRWASARPAMCWKSAGWCSTVTPRPSGAATSSRRPTWAGNGSAQGGCGERHAVQKDGQIGPQAVGYHPGYPVVRHRRWMRPPLGGSSTGLWTPASTASIPPTSTARTAGTPRQRGPAEEIVGRALKGRRESVVLATKVAAVTGPGANDRGLSRKHHPAGYRREPAPPADRLYRHLLPARARLRHPARGVARDAQRSGAAGQDPLHRHVQLLRLAGLQGCCGYTDKKNLAGIDCIQMVYNLLARDSELEMTRLCEAEGIGINVWGALAGGMLSGKFLEYDPEQAAAAGSQAVSIGLGSPRTSRP